MTSAHHVSGIPKREKKSEFVVDTVMTERKCSEALKDEKDASKEKDNVEVTCDSTFGVDIGETKSAGGHTRTVTHWLSSGIPFRPVWGTYAFVDDVARLPALAPDSLAIFAHIRTLTDVAIHAGWLTSVLQSPTACFVKVYVNEHLFYHDSQGCVQWCFEEGKGVYLYGSPSRVVATTLCEYFARTHTENAIWHKTALIQHEDAFVSYKISSTDRQNNPKGCGPTDKSHRLQDPKGLWHLLQMRLTPTEVTYLFNCATLFLSQI
jgi:hypothetical protein